MLRWRCLGDALGLPGASQGPIRADFRRQPKIYEKMGGFCEAAGTSRELPGDRKINEKSLVCQQKALQTWILCRYLCTKPLSMIFAWFCIKFSRKIAEHLMESLMYFFTSSLDFLNMVTLTKHRILRYESYFFSFLLFVLFSKKKHPKSNPKFKSHSFPQKTLKSGSGGCVLGPKMMPN